MLRELSGSQNPTQGEGRSGSSCCHRLTTSTCPELRIVPPSQPRSVCPDQSRQLGRQPAKRQVLCRDASLRFHSQYQGADRWRPVPDGGPRGQRCSERTESLGLSFPIRTVRTPRERAHQPGAAQEAASDPTAQGGTEGEARGAESPGPRPTSFTSLGLHLFDSWGRKQCLLYRFALRTKGAHAQKDVGKGPAHTWALIHRSWCYCYYHSPSWASR